MQPLRFFLHRLLGSRSQARTPTASRGGHHRAAIADGLRRGSPACARVMRGWRR